MHVTITISEESADALAVYLDEEEVFDDVVDTLLDALSPALMPESEPQPLSLHSQVRTAVEAYLAKYNNNKWAVQDNMVLRIRHTNGKVWCDGWNWATTEWDRHWFTHHPEDDQVGFYHVATDQFYLSNENMVSWLVEKGIIAPCKDDHEGMLDAVLHKSYRGG
jgi:hypothetical protein